MRDVGGTTYRPCPPREVGEATGMYSNCFYSPLLLILVSSGCFFSTEYDDRRGEMGRDQRGRDGVSFVPSSGGRGGGTGMCPLFFVLYSPLLFFSLFLFFDCFFEDYHHNHSRPVHFGEVHCRRVEILTDTSSPRGSFLVNIFWAHKNCLWHSFLAFRSPNITYFLASLPFSGNFTVASIFGSLCSCLP